VVLPALAESQEAAELAAAFQVLQNHDPAAEVASVRQGFVSPCKKLAKQCCGPQLVSSLLTVLPCLATRQHAASIQARIIQITFERQNGRHGTSIHTS
jgi:hypothetical protein